jgi:hypothetical protein
LRTLEDLDLSHIHERGAAEPRPAQVEPVEDLAHGVLEPEVHARAEAADEHLVVARNRLRVLERGDQGREALQVPDVVGEQGFARDH